MPKHSAAISGQAGRGRIACVVSAGNIDPAKLITFLLRGDVPYPTQADTPATKVTLALNPEKIFYFCCSSSGSEIDWCTLSDLAERNVFPHNRNKIIERATTRHNDRRASPASRDGSSTTL